jgi:hypothetical protein
LFSCCHCRAACTTMPHPMRDLKGLPRAGPGDTHNHDFVRSTGHLLASFGCGPCEVVKYAWAQQAQHESADCQLQAQAPPTQPQHCSPSTLSLDAFLHFILWLRHLQLLQLLPLPHPAAAHLCLQGCWHSAAAAGAIQAVPGPADADMSNLEAVLGSCSPPTVCR